MPRELAPLAGPSSLLNPPVAQKFRQKRAAARNNRACRAFIIAGELCALATKGSADVQNGCPVGGDGCMAGNVGCVCPAGWLGTPRRRSWRMGTLRLRSRRGRSRGLRPRRGQSARVWSWRLGPTRWCPAGWNGRPAGWNGRTARRNGDGHGYDGSHVARRC